MLETQRRSAGGKVPARASFRHDFTRAASMSDAMRSATTFGASGLTHGRRRAVGSCTERRRAARAVRSVPRLGARGELVTRRRRARSERAELPRPRR
jgi:hypothetical protein